MKSRSFGKAPSRQIVTLADVAREANVSQITVSRVVRQMGPISTATRDHVESVIKRVGYVPNGIASALASARSDLIGVIFPSLTNIVFPDVLRGIHDALSGRGFRVVVGVTNYSPKEEEDYIRSLLALRPVAIVLTGCEHTDATTTMLIRSGVVVVEIMDTDAAAIDLSVGMSHKQAAEASAAYLLRRGYQRFGYVGHDNRPRDLRAWRRRASFLGALAAGGMELIGECIIAEPSSVAAGRCATGRLLKAHPEIDAIYFSNDDMAIGGVFHCLASGIDVPGKVAIFGFNGLDLGQAMPKRLSTILTYRYDVGVSTGKAIIARIDNADAPKRTDVGFQLIEGATS